jgi:hypothetical protein
MAAARDHNSRAGVVQGMAAAADAVRDERQLKDETLYN